MAMPRAGARTLSDIKEPRVRIICTQCPRAGDYSVARLLDRYGDISQSELIKHLAADCPRWRASLSGRGCGARYAPD